MEAVNIMFEQNIGGSYIRKLDVKYTRKLQWLGHYILHFRFTITHVGLLSIMDATFDRPNWESLIKLNYIIITHVAMDNRAGKQMRR